MHGTSTCYEFGSLKNDEWCSGLVSTWVHPSFPLHRRAPWCGASLTSPISVRDKSLHQGSIRHTSISGVPTQK